MNFINCTNSRILTNFKQPTNIIIFVLFNFLKTFKHTCNLQQSHNSVTNLSVMRTRN